MKNKINKIFLLLIVLAFVSCKAQKKINDKIVFTNLNIKQLSKLPLHCIETEYPNKLSQTIGNASYLKTPKELHPAFYGCFDWHSSVHGHWSLVKLLKNNPNAFSTDEFQSILKK